MAGFEQVPLEATAWRAVEDQSRLVTTQFTESLADQARLEELIDEVKPKQPAFSGAGPDQVLHPLLRTPFRYPPLKHGSRFGSRAERGIWYGAEEVLTVLHELAYYRFVLASRTRAAQQPGSGSHSVFCADLRTDAAFDLYRSVTPQRRRALTSPTAYRSSQRLGAEARAAGVQVIRYPSARRTVDSAGEATACVAVLSPLAFRRRAPRGTPQRWLHQFDTSG